MGNLPKRRQLADKGKNTSRIIGEFGSEPSTEPRPQISGQFKERSEPDWRWSDADGKLNE